MALSDYTTALTDFLASPSEATKAAVLAYRAGLPDMVTADGVTTTLPNLSTLTTSLDSVVAGVSRSADTRRIIQARVGYGR